MFNFYYQPIMESILFKFFFFEVRTNLVKFSYLKNPMLKKIMDLLWYQFIRDLIEGSNGLLDYKNKSCKNFCQNYSAQIAFRDDYLVTYNLECFQIGNNLKKYIRDRVIYFTSQRDTSVPLRHYPFLNAVFLLISQRFFCTPPSPETNKY